MRKIAIIFGTRPEAIKMAPIIHEIKNNFNDIKPIVIVTSQHKEMLQSVLKLFEIVPDYDLDIMKHNQDLFEISTNILKRMKSTLMEVKPDLVLVQGDTSTTFLSSLAAYYLRIKIGHIEAGLRTHNKYSPFPEEMNRCMVGRLADYHFAPTDIAQNNLIDENIPSSNIIITGNTSIDALYWVVENILPKMEQDLRNKYDWIHKHERSILVTAHRRENFGKPLIRIIDAIKSLHKKHPDTTFTIPVHMNPNVREVVYKHLSGLDRIHLIDPVSYEEFIYIIKNSHIILSDSGGVQEEAPSLGKPVLVMRDTTERMEGIHAGTNLLIGTDTDKIVDTTTHLITKPNEYKKMTEVKNPYGDGHAAMKTMAWLSTKL